jgi:transcriptional regulator with XRE-family HTH domain
MSTKNSSFGELSNRLSILVSELARGSAVNFARETGINDKTLYTYLKGRLPSSEALFFICRRYNVNINWLLTGEGPIYIISEERADLDPDPEIAELMEGARRVLKSGNPVAFDALERNIRYFDFAIQQEKRMAHMETGMDRMARTMEKMEHELANLKGAGRENGNGSAGEPLSGKKVA